METGGWGEGRRLLPVHVERHERNRFTGLLQIWDVRFHENWKP